MSGCRNASPDKRVKAASARPAAFLLAVLVAGAAAAQETEQRTEPPPPFGILETFGRWLGDSKAKIDGQIKSSTDAARDAAKDAAEKAGQATTGMVLGWPGTKVAHGRVRCAVAPNGAPDCTEAANALCRSKGYGPGKSLEINTAEKCPTWVWLSGRPAPEGTCKIENFVLQATCQ